MHRLLFAQKARSFIAQGATPVNYVIPAGATAAPPCSMMFHSCGVGSIGSVDVGEPSPLYPRKRTNSRPSRVKHFQATHHFSVDVAHGLALLFGLGTRALPSWDSKTRWNNLWRDLAVEVTAGSSGHTNSPHPSSREGHHSTVGWISGFLLFDLILCSSHAAATS